MKEVWINRKNGSSAFFFPLPKDQRSSAASPFLTPWTRGCACLCGKISDTTGSWRFPVWTFMNFCIISSVRLVCDFSSKSSGLTTALENCPGAEKCQGGKDPTAVCELKRCNTQPFRIPAYKRAFGNCPRGQALALCLLPCGTIKSLPKLWDNIVEAKHISSGKKKKKSWKFSSCLTDQCLLSKKTLGSLGYRPSISDWWGFSPWPCWCLSCVLEMPAPVPKLGLP